jgi:hypothetical protein
MNETLIEARADTGTCMQAMVEALRVAQRTDMSSVRVELNRERSLMAHVLALTRSTSKSLINV